MNQTNLNIKDFLNHKYVRCDQFEDLILFHYKEDCVFERAWCDITRSARGIIFNKNTGELIAKPFNKFFNLGEMPETNIQNIDKNEPFYVTEKLDGSLGIGFFYNNEYHVTTKGSFYSEQGKWATDWARSHIKLQNINRQYTYLYEIIYPSNKIVIDYKGKEALILIGVINTLTGKEMDYNFLKQEAKNIGVEWVNIVFFNDLDNIVRMCKELPANEEGFVVTYKNTGLKIKIKGDEYLKIHKMLSNMTLLAYWEAYDVLEKKIPENFLAQIPEEFRTLSDDLNAKIIKLHDNYYNKVMKEYDTIKNKDTIKDFAIICQKEHKENMSMLINTFKGENDKLLNNIHKKVRPDANILPEFS